MSPSSGGDRGAPTRSRAPTRTCGAAGLTTLLTLLAPLALAPRARAETIDATSTTLLVGRADPRDGVIHTAVPVFELVSLRATEFRLRGLDDLAVVISGWGAVVPGDPVDGKHGLGDLDLAFAEGKLLRRRIVLRLGRQLLIGGAGRNLAFDGLSATAMPVRFVGLTAQAGVPVTPRFGVHRGDALVAARAFFKPAFDSEAGVSFLQVLDHGEIARRDLAIDARLVPSARVALAVSGFVLFSLPEQRLAEGNLTATWQLAARFEVSGDYRRTAPDLFLPRNSIFSVFSQETRDEAGGWIYWRLVPRLKLQGGYHVIVDPSGTGQDGSAKLTLTFGPEGQDSAGLESRRLTLPQTGYTLGRAFALLRLAPRILASLDASAFFFDADVNGERQSFVGAANLGYDLRADWRAVAGVIGSVTPFAEQRLEAMVRLCYQGTIRVCQVTP